MLKEQVSRVSKPLAEGAPEIYAGFSAAQRAINQSGLDLRLVELIKIRASQINGCGFCVEMHVNEARKRGVSDEKLHLLAVWEESPGVFSGRERAALLWTEEVTLLADNPIPDDVFDEVREQFSEQELTHLTASIAMINAWNRMMTPLRYPLRGVLAGRKPDGG